MPQRILIMGLPGAGKTYFAERLKKYLEENASISSKRMSSYEMAPAPSDMRAQVDWFNADDIRKRFNDWDFSKEGRIRQSLRMAEFAMRCTGEYVICDFVAPLPEMRHNFKADWTIWMDTIDAGRYEDTNKTFVAPEIYDFRINEKNAEKWVPFVGEMIIANKRMPANSVKKLCKCLVVGNHGMLGIEHCLNVRLLKPDKFVL